MNHMSLAPCGINCSICLGYQREKNRCAGCRNKGNKPYHCTVCSIKTCPEKDGDANLPCSRCSKYPCRRIKDLEKRYKSKYGESIYENFESIKRLGIRAFIRREKLKWTCPSCGKLLCVHRGKCISCGSANRYFPIAESTK